MQVNGKRKKESRIWNVEIEAIIRICIKFSEKKNKSSM